MTDPREGWVMGAVSFHCIREKLAKPMSFDTPPADKFPGFRAARSSLDAGLADDFAAFQVQVAGVTVDRVRGKRHTIFVEPYTRVERVRVWLLRLP